MISVIVPTFNEGNNIEVLLRHLKQCEGAELLQVIVADSPDSNDRGADIAIREGATGIICQERGRSRQMNCGAGFAIHPVLYFLHADVRPPRDFVFLILHALEEGSEFGTFCYQFNRSGVLLKLNAWFTKFDGLFAGGGDQSFFIRKNFFTKLGGFDETLLIMEDFDMYKRARKTGKKYTIVKTPVIVSGRKYEQHSWLKINWINLRIFLIYLTGGSQKNMIALNKKLNDKQV